MVQSSLIVLSNSQGSPWVSFYCVLLVTLIDRQPYYYSLSYSEVTAELEAQSIKSHKYFHPVRANLMFRLGSKLSGGGIMVERGKNQPQNLAGVRRYLL